MAALPAYVPEYDAEFTPARGLGEKMGTENVCGLFGWFAPPATPNPHRRTWAQYRARPLNGQRGMNPKGKAVPARNSGKNGGRSHNRKRSR